MEIQEGEYYDSDTNVKEMHKKGRDLTLAHKLWKDSEKVYGVTFDPWILFLNLNYVNLIQILNVSFLKIE